MSAQVYKFNHVQKRQNRILAITNKAVYNI